MKFLPVLGWLLLSVACMNAQEIPSRHALVLSVGRERAVYFGRFAAQYQMEYRYLLADRLQAAAGVGFASLNDYNLAEDANEVQRTRSIAPFIGLQFTAARWWDRLYIDLLLHGRYMVQTLDYTPEIIIQGDQVTSVTRAEYTLKKPMLGLGLQLTYDIGAHFFFGLQGSLYHLPGKSSLPNPKVEVIRNNGTFNITTSSTASPLSPIQALVLAGYRF